MRITGTEIIMLEKILGKLGYVKKSSFVEQLDFSIWLRGRVLPFAYTS